MPPGVAPQISSLLVGLGQSKIFSLHTPKTPSWGNLSIKKFFVLSNRPFVPVQSKQRGASFGHCIHPRRHTRIIFSGLLNVSDTKRPITNPGISKGAENAGRWLSRDVSFCLNKSDSGSLDHRQSHEAGKTVARPLTERERRRGPGGKANLLK